MKVLFLQSVARVADKGDIKDVSEGYANNFLIPQRLAKVINLKEEEQIKKNNEQREQVKKITQNLFQKEIKNLGGKEIVIKEKANEQGHLFSKVHKEEILKAMKEQLKIEIDEELIEINEPIKSTGVFDVRIGKEKGQVILKVVVESL